MKRSFLLIGVLAAIAWLTPVVGRAAESPKPNFIVILIDDMGYGDIGPFGSKLNRTPHLDRMAREGMKLTSFYAAPVCTPSRAQMMTGCYAKRVSLPNVLGPVCPIGLSAKEHTIADLLKRQGYATMAVGKWHLGDQADFLPTHHGFDHYLGLPYSNDMGGQGKGPRGRLQPLLPLLRDEVVIEAPANQDTLTSRYTEEAVKFISANKDRPFFLYLPHTAVHVPLHPGADFKGRSANGAFGDWVEEVDWSVGRVLDTLGKLKIAERTFVWFTSDNGPWLTQGRNGGTAGPLRGGKGTTWEGGMREPTIAWWPGRIAAGTVCDAAISEIDVLPTLVKLAGGEVPADRKIDGKDVWPLLAGRTSVSPHEALYYFNGNQLQAVRAGRWKLAITPQGTGLPKGAAQPVKHTGPRLYNLDNDIGELKDVAAQHPDVVERLEKLMEHIGADLGAAGTGPSVRPPDRVERPRPLLKRVVAEYD
ncbi:MAG: sulfatase [Thermoguttaceae bacterium]